MTQNRTGGIAKRLDDELEFLSRTMYDFNKSTATYLRDELGCKQVINPAVMTAISPTLRRRLNRCGNSVSVRCPSCNCHSSTTVNRGRS